MKLVEFIICGYFWNRRQKQLTTICFIHKDIKYRTVKVNLSGVFSSHLLRSGNFGIEVGLLTQRSCVSD
jgi:hypothetical protein